MTELLNDVEKRRNQAFPNLLDPAVTSAADAAGGAMDADVSTGPDWLDSGEVVSGWHRRYRALLVVADLLSLTFALVTAYVVRFGSLANAGQVRYLGLLELAIGAVWVVCLYACDAYEVRRVVTGPEEWRRLARSGALAALLCVAGCYFLRWDVARGLLLVVFPLGIVAVAAGRLTVRPFVRVRRRSRGWQHRILAVGSAESVRHLIETSARLRHAGLRVVGACVDDVRAGTQIDGVPVVGTVDQAADLAAVLETDVVALAGGGLSPSHVRELSWRLEGTGRGLVMSHSVSDIARPRLHVRPMEGMPWVWVDQPQFTGVVRQVKRAFDMTSAAFGLLLLFPALLVVAILVKTTSRGPVFFKQSRLGRNGDAFDVFKFRTMNDGAEAMRAALMEHNEGDGALFKMRSDPRITPLGGWLRRLSIDELPQLWNVVRGDMSLVGPRPLAAIDSTYTGHARRRLLVRPGITGMWQVSGRSDLSWDESVRLDLYYVENWSLGLDLALISRTIGAVLKRRGAY